jgi:ABC-2 type transport system ATP-binding protein
VSESVIEVESLVKHYGVVRAVDEVSFRVERGEVYGLLGPNGAGKSTTVEILEGHRHRSSGTVSVFGVDPHNAPSVHRDRVGIVLQSSAMEAKLTVRETVVLYASPYRRARGVDDCIDLVGLGAVADQRYETLSGGQQRRLDLAVGIVGTPELLFLDEPTTGFDPEARRGAWELVRSLCSDGTTVVLTSHYLDEVAALADRVGVIVAGKMVAEGTPGELTAASGMTIVRFELPRGVQLTDLPRIASEPVIGADGRVEVTTLTPTVIVHSLTGWAIDRGEELHGLSVAPPSLEDTFLSLLDTDATSDAAKATASATAVAATPGDAAGASDE